MATQPVDSQCIFCRIARREIPSSLVYATDDAVAFLDIQPITPGHLLVIPVGHYATLAETPPTVLSALAAELPFLSRGLMQALDAPALNVFCNNGSEAGQVVRHVHFHLVPRRSDDGLIRHVEGRPQAADQRGEICNRIIAALQR